MRIFTGAPMPAGANAVIMQENAEIDCDRVRFTAGTKAGAHVRHRGSDLAIGQTAIAAGTILDAGEIGMLASQGVANVNVWRRPRVAIVCTGDELRDVSQPLTPGTLHNSNGYALAAAVESTGAEAWMLPIARDDADVIAATLQDAFTADVVLCCGGVSVGDYDLVADAVAKLGVRTVFHKVAMKPGKPLLFGLRGATPFVGLPGNPVSAWVGFEVFVRPCLRKMLGHTRVHTRSIMVTLGHAHTRSTGRMELARARFEPGTNPIVAHLTAQQGSGSLPSIVGIDALVVLPPEIEHFALGDRLPALVLHEARGQLSSAFS
jgi:molybdopterin molybdotransferase